MTCNGRCCKWQFNGFLLGVRDRSRRACRMNAWNIKTCRYFIWSVLISFTDTSSRKWGINGRGRVRSPTLSAQSGAATPEQLRNGSRWTTRPATSSFRRWINLRLIFPKFLQHKGTLPGDIINLPYGTSQPAYWGPLDDLWNQFQRARSQWSASVSFYYHKPIDYNIKKTWAEVMIQLLRHD